MAQSSKRKYYAPLLGIAGILSIVTSSLLIFSILSQKKEKNEQPFDIVVANVTTSSVEIYWKTKRIKPQTVSFKEKYSTAPYKTATPTTSLNDILTSSNLYIQKLENLNAGETYIFKIKSGNTSVEKNLTFKTLPISKELILPTIEVGEAPKGTLVLISTEHQKYILDTQYHGTWAFDSKGEKYTTSNYANYTPEEILTNSLNQYLQSKSIYGIQKAYAEDRNSPEAPANCKVGIKIEKALNLPPNQWKAEDVIGRWTYVPKSPIEGNGCPGGNYSRLCYADVYCRAVEAGVNPGAVFAVWANESGGSNYARFLAKQRLGHYGKDAKLADFGIEYDAKVPHFNFSKQIDWFLEHNTGIGYIGDCVKDSGYSNLDVWGIKFRDGTKHCKTKAALEARLNSTAGSYGKHIGTIYRWFTGGELVFPFTIEKMSGVCDRSNQKDNTTIMTCADSHIPSIPYVPNPPPLNPTIIGNFGSHSNTPPKEISGKPQSIPDDSGPGKLTVTDQTRYCAEEQGCTCTYKDGKTLKIQNGWSCTPDGEEERTREICCQIPNRGMWTVAEYNCPSPYKIREDIKKGECNSENLTYSLRTGYNFIQLQEVHNSGEIPMQTANDLLKLANGAITSISKFNEGEWQETVKFEDGKIFGTSFDLKPGESYFVTTKTDLALNTLGNRISFSLNEMPTKAGWSMVGSNLFLPASSTHSILTNETYKNIQQIAIWDTTKNKFIYTARDKELISGADVGLPDNGAVFVRI